MLFINDYQIIMGFNFCNCIKSYLSLNKEELELMLSYTKFKVVSNALTPALPLPPYPQDQIRWAHILITIQHLFTEQPARSLDYGEHRVM